MAQAQVRFPVRLLGYDRKAVTAALTSVQHQLQRAEARRDELVAASSNVEHIGAQVADMLRTLADRAVELEVEAAAKAAEVVQGAQAEAEQIRAQAAAVLAAAELEAQQLVETARRQQATIAERRETARVSLQIAIDQMGRLATTVDQIDLTALDPVEPPTVGPGPEPEERSDAPAPEAALHLDPAPPEDPIAPALDRLEAWVRTS